LINQISKGPTSVSLFLTVLSTLTFVTRNAAEQQQQQYLPGAAQQQQQEEEDEDVFDPWAPLDMHDDSGMAKKPFRKAKRLPRFKPALPPALPTDAAVVLPAAPGQSSELCLVAGRTCSLAIPMCTSRCMSHVACKNTMAHCLGCRQAGICRVSASAAAHAASEAGRGGGAAFGGGQELSIRCATSGAGGRCGGTG
jgi:hypothetical protein